jgi:nucleoside-diphosphate-sugar epimerase
MRILMTGGSGDLGRVLAPELVARADAVSNLDICQPKEATGRFVQGSVLDRQLLQSVLPDVDCVVHIAAWHGIHEFRHEKDAFEFWELNVTGTFNLLECCARAGCSKLVYISSTSVDAWLGMYAHSKLVGEDLMRTYSARHGMRIITLRPRAFIPHWNRTVYASFAEWAQWYWKGAVHINDVAQSVVKAVDALASAPDQTYAALTIDGACDFTQEEMESWDRQGAGTTFKQRFGEERYRLAVECGLDPACKPNTLGSVDGERMIGYRAEYGFAKMLEELAEHSATAAAGGASH